MTQTQHPVPATAGSTAESTAERMMRLTGQHVGAGFITRYVLGQLGVWIALMTPAAVTLSLRVGDVDPANKAASLSLIAGLGAACALFANPIFGRLSDKSTSRFGQRRPFILGGVLVGIIATFFLGAATTIPMIAVAWCIAQVGFNTALAATVAVLPERVPAHKRGRVSAWLGSGSQVGAVAGTFLVQGTGTQGVWMFLAPAALALVLVVIFVAGLKEAPRTRAEVGRFRLADIFTALWINPFRSGPSDWRGWVASSSGPHWPC
ncbi:MFS family permease [Microbacterium sp. SORGH_AS 1204]|uniref:MFS transporter n=1 Tax=Microbacterium sp. SORGH_AS_1204 TaxID=3041785 RepID=UPI002793F4AE|nr:MFS transporter [Microbacterium sp. SORGH_AS_1204]MDQ1136375.1 MFS family permease [Microbacterium sp. SORGH_AS_1204]